MTPAGSPFEDAVETNNLPDTMRGQRHSQTGLKTEQVPDSAGSALAKSLLASLVNRIDAWGVTLMVCMIAFYLHDAVRLQTVVLSLAMAGMYWLG